MPSRVKTASVVVTQPIARPEQTPRQRKPVEQLNISRETSKSKRTPEEWNELLKGKRFTDEDGSFEILKVIRSPDYKNEIVEEIVNVKDLNKNGAAKKERCNIRSVP